VGNLTGAAGGGGLGDTLGGVTGTLGNLTSGLGLGSLLGSGEGLSVLGIVGIGMHGTSIRLRTRR
jgi:hypothetical protein